ncbi:MFS transporter [Planobispora takensis]|nr:MFS transporter [Planobispora takensis]
MSQPATAKQAGAPQLVLLLIGSCMPVLGAVLLSPVLPRISEHFASTPGVDVLVPVILTIPALFVALGAPFAGAVADRFDRKRLLIVTMVGYAIAGTATAFFALGGLLGADGWRTPFWLYAAAALAAIPMALLLRQPAAHQEDAHQQDARQEEARDGDRQPWPWRPLLVPSLVTVGGGVVFYTLIVQLAYVLDGVGISDPAVIGGVTALMSLATAVGAGLFAKISGRGARVLLIAEFALSGLGLLLIAATEAVPVIVAGAVLTGFATGLLLPTLLTWAVNRLPFAQRGRGTGLWTGALFLGEFLSPLLIGALAAVTGGLGPSLGVIGVASLVLAALVATVLTVPAAPLNTVPAE